MSHKTRCKQQVRFEHTKSVRVYAKDDHMRGWFYKSMKRLLACLPIPRQQQKQGNRKNPHCKRECNASDRPKQDTQLPVYCYYRKDVREPAAHPMRLPYIQHIEKRDVGSMQRAKYHKLIEETLETPSLRTGWASGRLGVYGNNPGKWFIVDYDTALTIIPEIAKEIIHKKNRQLASHALFTWKGKTERARIICRTATEKLLTLINNIDDMIQQITPTDHCYTDSEPSSPTYRQLTRMLRESHQCA